MIRIKSQQQRAFTLVELLMVVLIISILSAMTLSALSNVVAEGKVDRARNQISKIDALISEKWNSYRYRQVPMRIYANDTRVAANDPRYLREVARLRLQALRELQRMELPDRLADILDGPVTLGYQATTGTVDTNYAPSLTLAYRRQLASNNPSITNIATIPNYSFEQAECLYLILSQMKDGERSALSFFSETEIGDRDNDGLLEVQDPWGMPIQYLRWAPGYSRVISSDNEMMNVTAPTLTYSVVTSQVPNGLIAPDTFDPMKADRRWEYAPNDFRPFALWPLIFSAGPDKEYDIRVGFQAGIAYRASQQNPPNYPYYPGTDGNTWLGTVYDDDGEGVLNHGDNVTNHGIRINDAN